MSYNYHDEIGAGNFFKGWPEVPAKIGDMEIRLKDLKALHQEPSEEVWKVDEWKWRGRYGSTDEMILTHKETGARVVVTLGSVRGHNGTGSLWRVYAIED